MISFKFITVKGGDKKSSALTGSVRSHAIRAGLRKTARPPKGKTAEQSPGLKQSRNAHNLGGEGHERMKLVPGEKELSTTSTEPILGEPALFEPNEKVKMCVRSTCIYLEADNISALDFNTAYDTFCLPWQR